MESLTDKAFWTRYWENKTHMIQPISRKYIFGDLFESIIHQYQPKTALEIGGFPGFYSVFLKKYFGLDTYLVDIVVIEDFLKRLLEANQLSGDSVHAIESDLFQWKPDRLFDLVYSNGFIEHFDDTLKVVQSHVDLVNPGGIVLITLPNFRSLNGWFQKIFDPVNYAKHNIACMDVAFLRYVARQAGLTNVQVFYYGYFSIWLEPTARYKPLAKLFRLLCFYPSKAFFKILKINIKPFAPYLVLMGQRSNNISE